MGIYLLQDYLTLSAVLLIGVLSELTTEHSISHTFTVYQDIAILLTHDWTPDHAIDWIQDSATD